MTHKRKRHFVEYHIISGKFMGFTNTGYDTMFFAHSGNGHNSGNNKWLPALIKVDDKVLQSTLKKTCPNTEMQITLELGSQADNAYGAKLVNIIPET